jgi:predicted DNA-binding transcriptional regulator AlpA
VSAELTAPPSCGEGAPPSRPPLTPADLAALAGLPDDAAVDVRPVSRLLACSARHVWRLVDAGLMPPPLALGRLRRWRIGTLRDWLRQGARPVRQEGRR